MSVHKPRVVRHFWRRAESFFGAAGDLDVLGAEVHGPAIGLLAVHSCIALADAVLVASEGIRAAAEDHAEAARKLRKWCSVKGIQDQGIKHFDWLLGRKNHLSYDERPVREDELQLAKVKMDQFFLWALRAFPAVAEIKESSNA